MKKEDDCCSLFDDGSDITRYEWCVIGIAVLLLAVPLIVLAGIGTAYDLLTGKLIRL